MIGLLFAAPAFVAPASALVSRRAAVTMNAEPEATRDSAPPVAFTTPPTRATDFARDKAPTSGYTLSLDGGERTIADVKAAQVKAAKGFTKADGDSDLKRVQKGWTTN